MDHKYKKYLEPNSSTETPKRTKKRRRRDKVRVQQTAVTNSFSDSTNHQVTGSSREATADAGSTGSIHTQDLESATSDDGTGGSQCPSDESTPVGSVISPALNQAGSSNASDFCEGSTTYSYSDPESVIPRNMLESNQQQDSSSMHMSDESTFTEESDIEFENSEFELPDFSDNNYSSFESEDSNESDQECQDEPRYDFGINEDMEILPGCCTFAEATSLVLALSFKYVLSEVATVDIFNIMNIMLKRSIFPSSVYKVKKLFTSQNQTYYHLYCQKCKVYLGQLNSTNRSKFCTGCQTDVKIDVKNINYFGFFNLKSEFKRVLQRVTLPSENLPQEYLADIGDGHAYQELCKDLGKVETFNFFFDGAQVFKSGKSSLTCLLLSLNGLPPEIRFKNILVGGIWFSRREFLIDVFMQPFVKNCNELATEGITWTDSSGKENHSKFVTFCAIADTVARPKLQCSTAHNGRSGCPWCLHTNSAEGRRSNRYEMQAGPLPELRTDEQWQRDAMKAEETSQRVRGIIGKSVLLKILHFKIKTFVNVEEMHGSFGGVAKFITENIFLAYSKNPYYIASPCKLRRIQKLMKNFRLPSLIDSRSPQNINDHTIWKASQWKYWLLYISVPVLLEVTDIKFVTHWGLFVKSIFILSSTNISFGKLEECESLLLHFVWGVQLLYGPQYMTFNIHSLLHYPMCVKNCGPLWAFSAFPYESFIASLLTKVTSSGGVVNQIMDRVSKYNHLPDVIREKSNNEDVISFCQSALHRKMPDNDERSSKVCGHGKILQTEDEEEEEEERICYQKFVQNGEYYRTYSSQCGTQKLDACILLKNNKFGLIREIFKVDEEVFVNVEVLENNEVVLPQVNHNGFTFGPVTLPHIFSCNRTINRSIVTVKTSEVLKKCIFLECSEEKNFICVTPNSYEKQ